MTFGLSVSVLRVSTTLAFYGIKLGTETDRAVIVSVNAVVHFFKC